jgi:drug/metabolite transporter (DMT)-like permease
MRFYGLDQTVVPTAAFQKAAKEILATYGGGGVINPALSDAPPKAAFVVAGGALLLGSAFAALSGVYMFRHTKDEKNTFWKVVGYAGGVSSMLAAITLLLSSVASAVTALPATQGQS